MASGRSVEVGFGSAGLVPLMGKDSVSNIRVPLGFAVIPKALARARLSVVASALAILPLPRARFRALALYCTISWHLTANLPPRLAPYCSPPAGTLLLLTRWHPTAHHPGWHPLCPVAPLALLSPSDRSTLPRLRLVVVEHCLHGNGPTHWIDVMTCTTARVVLMGPRVSVFSHVGDHLSSPSGPERVLELPSFLFFWGAC